MASLIRGDATHIRRVVTGAKQLNKSKCTGAANERAESEISEKCRADLNEPLINKAAGEAVRRRWCCHVKTSARGLRERLQFCGAAVYCSIAGQRLNSDSRLMRLGICAGSRTAF